MKSTVWDVHRSHLPWSHHSPGVKLVRDV
jgi:hypothetical protein